VATVPPKGQWTRLLRAYLAGRLTDHAQQAFDHAPPLVQEFLAAVGSSEHSERVRTLRQALSQLEPDDRDGALTIRLAFADAYASTSTVTAPPHPIPDDVRAAMRACGEALVLARELGDAACIAYYASTLADFSERHGSLSDAEAGYREALTHYRALAWQSPAVVAQRWGATCSQLACILRDTHSPEASRDLFEEGVAVWRRLVSDEGTAYHRQLALALHCLGDVQSKMGEYEPARRSLEESARLIRGDRRPDRVELAAVLHNLAAVSSNLGDDVTGPRLAEEALALKRDAATPAPSTDLNSLSSTLILHGDLCSQAGDWSKARESYEEAIRIHRSSDAGARTATPVTFADVLLKFGTALTHLDKWAEARDALSEAIRLYRTNVEPQSSPSAGLRLANAMTILSGALFVGHELEQARTVGTEALDLYEQLGPDQGVIGTNAIVALVTLGLTLRGLHDRQGASSAYKRALERLLDVSVKNDRRPELWRDTLLAVGRQLQALGDIETARAACEATLRHCRVLATGAPSAHLPQLVSLLHFKGSLLYSSHRDEARRALEESLAVRATLDEAIAADLPDFADTLNLLGCLCRDIRDLEASQTSLETALARLTASPLSDSDSADRFERVALILNNLGNTLLDRNKLEAGTRALHDSLALRRRLAAADPERFNTYVADTLVNMGNAMMRIDQETLAGNCYREALSIYRLCSAEDVTAYRRHIAGAMSNLAFTGGGSEGETTARRTPDEALAMYRELAASDLDLPRAEFANALNSIGVGFAECGDVETALQLHEEALTIARELYNREPAAHALSLARILGNMGNRFERGHPSRRECYREALHILRDREAWLEAAIPCAQLASAEAEAMHIDEAIRLSEEAVAYLDRGLSCLDAMEHSHRDKFKKDVEGAYLRLIGHYAAHANIDMRRRLPHLFESLRNVELLSLFGGSAQVVYAWQEALASIEAGVGSVAEHMRALKAVFVWVQQVDNALVLGVLRVGQPFVAYTAGDDLAVTFTDMAEGLENWRPSRYSIDVGAAAYELLPTAFKDRYVSDDVETIFLSTCSHSTGYPFELLAARGTYLGLTKLFVNAHSLTELSSVLGRSPTSNHAVVIGNPAGTGTDLPDLPEALAASRRIEGRLASRGWQTTSAYQADATRQQTFDSLRNSPVGLFVFCGHGNPGRLVLAGQEELYWIDLAYCHWTAHPVVHLDCCYAGMDWGRGGGRFEGMPVASLRAGAGAVLASRHIVYDEPAGYFTERLYEQLLDEKTSRTLGDALMAARRATHAKFDRDARHWASTRLWGNPHAVLVLPQSE
jgi:tetratricopeptide (TPR) repeat protein